MNKTTKFIFAVFLFWNILYFSICSLAGYSNEDGESAPFKLLGIIVLAAISFLIIFVNKFRGIFTKKLYTIIIPVFITVFYFLDSLNSPISYFQYYKYFLGFGIPSLIVGSYISTNGGIQMLSKWFDIVMLIVTCGLISAVPNIVFNSVISVGGASYQQMAYMASFAFLINLCGFLYGDEYERFEIFNNKKIKFICLLLMVVQLVTCLFSGGRGGFIVLVLGSGLLLLYKHKLNYLFYILAFFLIVYGASTFFKDTLFYEVIGVRMERTFSFISNSGTIDTQTRGEVWDYGIKYIRQQGFFGAGLYKYYYEFRQYYDQPYAHNLFLDFLCQGGPIYLIVWVVLLVQFFMKFAKIIKEDTSQILLLVLVTYSFTELMFSGTYLYVAMFWFLISYMYSYKPQCL